MMVSNIVLLRPLPESVMKSIEAYVGCLVGAMLRNEYIRVIKRARFNSHPMNRHGVGFYPALRSAAVVAQTVNGERELLHSSVDPFFYKHHRG